MPQADTGKGGLQRFSLQIKTNGGDRWYNFVVNPEDYEESHPQRVTSFKTREAVVVEDFGPELGTIRFSGTTGFRAVEEENGTVRNGAQRLFELENFIDQYSQSGYSTEPGGNPNNAELIFYNRTDDKSWYVHLGEEGLVITRSAEESLLYRYTLNLTILRRASEPSEREIDKSAIGNPIPSIEDYKTSSYYISQAINPRSSKNVSSSASNNIGKTIGTAHSRDGVTLMMN